jgi:DNA-binding NtrC family response regulator
MQKSRILAIDDNREILLSLRVVLGKHFAEVKCHAEPNTEAESNIAQNKYDVALLDMNFSPGATSGEEGLAFLEKIKSLDPNLSVVMITAYGDIDLAVKAMKLGATDFVVKPWENKKLLATVTSAIKLTLSRREIGSLQDSQKVVSRIADKPFEQMVGISDVMRKVYENIEKVACTDANVLILGENGTGKELVARAIHRFSARHDKLFVAVDMGSIAESLFESELFGHTKGAFTNANEDRVGRFEAANKGTIFLDEIANIPLNLQSKLLSVIQTREVTRVGSSNPKPIDIRLISATNANINQLVENSLFRQDLYFRINTVEITLPPLRDRGDDIFLLANHYLNFYTQKYGKPKMELSKNSQKKMISYNWPGNVRELQHALERAVIMSDTSTIEPESLFLSGKNKPNETPVGQNLNIEAIEKQAIIQSLKTNKGNISLAAKELGLGRTTLYRKIEKYDI